MSQAVRNSLGAAAIERCQVHKGRNVVELRWTATGMLKARKSFRHLSGYHAYQQLPIRRGALAEVMRQAQTDSDLKTIMNAAKPAHSAMPASPFSTEEGTSRVHDSTEVMREGGLFFGVADGVLCVRKEHESR